VGLAALVFFVGILLNFAVNFQPRFYPTMEEAFRRHSGSSGRMGEIIFIDEHEDSVTVRHWVGDVIYVSHYVRKIEGDNVLYHCVGVSQGGIPLDFTPESIDRYHHILSMALRDAGHHRRDLLYLSLNRRPLHGISTDSNIFNLRINDQAPDHVMLSNVAPAGPVFGEETNIYFWYFSNFRFEPGDEIIIAFE